MFFDLLKENKKILQYIIIPKRKLKFNLLYIKLQVYSLHFHPTPNLDRHPHQPTNPWQTPPTNTHTPHHTIHTTPRNKIPRKHRKTKTKAHSY